jgi:hypothetical protein
VEAAPGLRRKYQDFQMITGAPEEIRTPDPQIRRLLCIVVFKAVFYKSSQLVGV